MEKIFFLLLNIFTVIYGVIYDCTTEDTVYLRTDEIAFFETNNYPTLMETNDFNNNCKLNFALNTTLVNTTHPVAYIVFTEITLTRSERNVIIKDALKYSLFKNFLNESSAQKGFILFDDYPTSCPLSSIATIEPFAFEDDSQILYLRSTYDTVKFNRTTPCKWTFTAPDGYGFKFVVETWDVSNLTLLTVFNRTDTITNEIGLQTYHPYYNPDQWMRITLSKDLTHTIKGMEFEAYVTLVKKEFPNIDAKCTNNTVDFKTVWTMDKEKGYGKNVNCSYPLIIPPKNEILVEIDNIVFEKGVDYIKYYPEGNPRNYTIFDSSTTFIIESFGNKSDEHLIWEFVTDGSIQSSGFEVSFTKLPCICNDANIDCEVPDFNVMKFTNDNYCGSLSCNFTISCAKDMVKIVFEPHDVGADQVLFDIFTVYSNGEIVLEINHENRYIGKFPVYLNSQNNNMFQVAANVSHNVKWLNIAVSPFKAPKFNLVKNLTAEESTAIIDTANIDTVLFEIGKDVETQSFVVHSTFSEGGSLYNNESLSLKLFGEKCFERYEWSYKCEIPTSKFVAFTPSTSDKFPFLAVRLTNSHKGCLFDENIFSTKNASFVSIAAIATSEAECNITLLIDDLSYYYVSHLYTTSVTEMVQVFIGIDQTTEFFHFNSENADDSANAGLFSKVYTIKIPKSTTFLMYLTRYTLKPIVISQRSYQSLITTPNFATTKMNILTYDFVTYQIAKNINVRFTALNYSMAKSDNFYFLVNDAQKIKIEKAGDTKTFTNQKVTLHYSYVQNKDTTNGASFHVEAL